jgi:U3 small nucleolar RNA-associated protein 25
VIPFTSIQNSKLNLKNCTFSSFTMVKAKKATKNKGPKGKKARAKAKLERQWGETQSGEVKIRTGKSRLLLNSKKTKNKKRELEDGDRLMEQSFDSDESDVEEEEGGKFIESISKQRRQGPDEDEESEEDINSTTAEQMVEEEEEDEEESEENELQLEAFTERFSRSPLDENNSETLLADLQQTITLSVPSDDSLVVQASPSLCRKLELEKQLSERQGKRLTKAYSSSSSQLVPPLKLSGQESMLYPFLASYADVMLTCDDKLSHDKSLSFHILNHVLTSRQRIFKHDKRLKEEEDETTTAFWRRDQGFTRPTVLVLLPTRGCCHTFVHNLLSLLDGNTTDNLDRFDTEFGPPEMQTLDETALNRRRKVQQSKGKEWTEVFGDEVNDDDDFRIGLALIPKARKKKDNDVVVGVKLFTDFYRSDIIVASPLGLKMSCIDKEEGSDFLSSIEICVLSRTDVLLMQNWDHVHSIMSLLNQQPKGTHDTDFSRVREYMLAGQAGQAKHWRQLIMTSRFLDPMILSTFKRNAASLDGMARIRKKTSAESAMITRVLLPTRQVFQRVSSSCLAEQSQERINYFADKVLPQLENQKHSLVYIPSYFDFITVRNILLKREMDFVSVTEYSRVSEVSRGRARFLQGRKPIMLYTGRAHFFHRHTIKGARRVIFLGLPEHAEFYTQHVNLLVEHQHQDGSSSSSLALFTKYDAQALERIVGSLNCSKMIKGDKSSFLLGH